jgi:hypothetical protein
MQTMEKSEQDVDMKARLSRVSLSLYVEEMYLVGIVIISEFGIDSRHQLLQVIIIRVRAIAQDSRQIKQLQQLQ